MPLWPRVETRILVRWSLLILWGCGSLAGSAQQLVDRILASVDGDPILASEVERAVGLGLEVRRPAENDRDYRRRVLDGLIEQRLRVHEVDRFGFTEVSSAEVDRAVERMREELGDESAFQRRLVELDLDAEGLRRLVHRQLVVLAYVEERVGPRVFVSLDDIRAYYEAVLRPELEARGETPPPLEDVRERIRGVLREQRLTAEVARWTDELRAAATIEDHFERQSDALPPVRFEIR
jgi:SurA N-terminal domain